MSTIQSLHKSISQMSKEELEQRLLSIRKNIRESKKAVKISSKKSSAKSAKVEKPLDMKAMFALMSEEEKTEFLKSLGE
jgi:hypothetical protein